MPGPAAQGGGRWADHGEVIEAISWKYRTGSPWRELPADFGSWKDAYSRFRRWTLGTWQRLLAAVQAASELESAPIPVSTKRSRGMVVFVGDVWGGCPTGRGAIRVGSGYGR